MIDHVTIRVTDFERSKRFYMNSLETLGYRPPFEPEPRTAGFSINGNYTFWLYQDQEKAGPCHIAFSASNRQSVDSFYKVALHFGGRDNGKPGIRHEYSAGYYAAFVLDPDGNNVEAVFQSTKIRP